MEGRGSAIPVHECLNAVSIAATQMLLEKNLRLTITISKKIVPACAFV